MPAADSTDLAVGDLVTILDGTRRWEVTRVEHMGLVDPDDSSWTDTMVKIWPAAEDAHLFPDDPDWTFANGQWVSPNLLRKASK